MILKASQRGGGRQLAVHLMNAVDNERVEFADLRGAIANDIHGAFSEWEAEASGTNCRKYLYSLSISPDPAQGRLTREQYADYIARVEKTLGLSGQARAIVFHVKQTREHCHVVWSRIDTDRMKSIHISRDREKLQEITRAFARDHGLELPRGMNKNKGKDRFKGRETYGEKQQEERTGIKKKQREAEITFMWATTIDGPSFVSALEKRGYVLARGDRRGYCIVDRFGEIHSLARQINGVNAKGVAARLAVCPLEKLPSATAVKEQSRQRAQIRLREHFQLQADARKATLAREHAQRRAVLEKKKADMRLRHTRQLEKLVAAQAAGNRALAEEREAAKPRGLVKFLGKITGVSKAVQRKHHRTDTIRITKQQHRIEALKRQQAREAREMRRQFASLGRVEKRERRALDTAIRREFLSAPNLPAPERQPATPAPTPAEPEKQIPQEFHETGKELTAPEREGPHLSDEFREALRQHENRKDRQIGRDKGPGRDRTR